jgi:hypothetical protein
LTGDDWTDVERKLLEGNEPGLREYLAELDETAPSRDETSRKRHGSSRPDNLRPKPRKKPRKCRVCFELIPKGKRADAIYCSDACKAWAYRKRHRGFRRPWRI